MRKIDDGRWLVGCVRLSSGDARRLIFQLGMRTRLVYPSHPHHPHTYTYILTGVRALFSLLYFRSGGGETKQLRRRWNGTRDRRRRQGSGAISGQPESVRPLLLHLRPDALLWIKLPQDNEDPQEVRLFFYTFSSFFIYSPISRV